MTGNWALVRLAVRGIRRQLRTVWLVVVLIAIPVAAGSYLAVAQRTVSDHGLSRAQLAGVGDAEILVTGGEFGVTVYGAEATGQRTATRPKFAENLLRLADSVEGVDAGALARWEFREVDGPVRSQSTRVGTVVAADWSRPAATEAFHSINGRLPRSSGEVALDRRAASTLSLDLGDRFETVAGSFADVVGIVTPFDADQSASSTVYISDDIVTLSVLHERKSFGFVLGVNSLDRSQVLDVLNEQGLRQYGSTSAVVVESGQDEAVRYRDGYVDPSGRPEQAGALVTGALLVETGLLAAAAFAVRSRRRVGEVARLTALGATPPQISRMMLVEAGLLGLCGAVLGAGVAAIAAVANPLLLIRAGTLMAPIEPGAGLEIQFHPWDMALPIVLAVVAATLAAWLPARRASRMHSHRAGLASSEPDTAVRRRPSMPQTLFGPVLLAASLGAVYLWAQIDKTPGGKNSALAPVVIVMALLFLIAATIAFTSTIVDKLDQQGEWLPFPLRFGLRQMARNRTRSAVLAGSTAVFTMMAMIVLALYSIGDPAQFRVPPETTVARVSAAGPSGPYLDIGHLNLSGGNNSVEGTSTAVEPSSLALVGANVVVDQQVPLHYVADSEGARAGFTVSTTPDLSYDLLTENVGAAVVATPELLDAINLDQDVEATLNRPGVAVVTSTFSRPMANLWDSEDLSIDTVRTPRTTVEVIKVDRPDLWKAGITALIAPGQAPGGYRAEVNGEPSEWLVTSTQGFTKAEGDWLRNQPVVDVATVGNSGHQNLRVQVIVLMAVGALVLIVARLAAGLVAVESDRDTAVMAAVGAPAGIRRRLLGSQIGIMTAMSVLTAIPLGLVFVWAFLATIEKATFPSWVSDGPLLPIPLYFIALSLLLPIVAALFVTLTTRPNPSTSPGRMSRRIA